MNGKRRAAEQDHDLKISLAWHTAAFNAATKSKQGLKPLRHYLSASQPPKAQTPEETLAQFKALQSIGVPFKISRVDP